MSSSSIRFSFAMLSIAVTSLFFLDLKQYIYPRRPQLLIVSNQYGQEVSLDYDQVKQLIRILKHDGLEQEEIDRLYSLEYRPIADEVVRDKPFEMQCLKALERKKYVELKDGIWLLTSEGREAVKR